MQSNTGQICKNNLSNLLPSLDTMVQSTRWLKGPTCFFVTRSILTISTQTVEQLTQNDSK